MEAWSKIYGPIYTLWIGRRPTLVVSDPNIAVDLMEKRSNKYSSRPRVVVMGEIYWDMASILVQPYGKKWSIRRKLLHTALTPSSLRLYKPIQQAEASRMCYAMLSAPMDWEAWIERYTSSIVFSVSYGHRIDDLNSPIINERLGFMHYSASLNLPGAFLAETFPILKHVPDFLAPWKRQVKARGREEAEANMQLVREVQEELRMAKSPSDIPDSLCKQLLAARAADPEAFNLLDDRDFSFVPASLFGSGSDTTASTLCSCFLGLITHPEVLEAAHAELDSVIGSDRTPTFADEASLPYIRALCKETLRWRPVAVLGGTPHASTEPDNYKGWYIPADTTVLGNNWAINRNPEYYPNPDHFNPLRFLDKPATTLSYLPEKYASGAAEKGKPHPSKLGHSSFGWGRRICPGADLASNSLFVAVAKLLWSFDITPIEGRRYDIFNYTDGFNIRPKKFECKVQVRSEKHKEVLTQEVSDANQVMAKFTTFEERRALKM